MGKHLVNKSQPHCCDWECCVRQVPVPECHDLSTFSILRLNIASRFHIDFCSQCTHFHTDFRRKITQFLANLKMFYEIIMEKSRILLGITSSYILHLEQMGKHLVKQKSQPYCCDWDVFVRQVPVPECFLHIHSNFISLINSVLVIFLPFMSKISKILYLPPSL